MAVRLQCPNPDCLASYSLSEVDLGHSLRCKKCGWVFELSSSKDADATDRQAPSLMHELAPGMTFGGRYEIKRVLGRGGMGVVYLARDRGLGREVALKIPQAMAGEGEDAEIYRRFTHEARAAAAIDHPNICPIYDVGQVDGVHYLTMAYIEGQPLTSLLAGGPLPEARAAEVVLTLARALSEAHRLGVVHRDLKPSNILVGTRRGPVIMDFGLARSLAGEATRLTQSGQLLGTPGYMAPEQVRGDVTAMGPACDIFSLGVILYELLTGRRPFTGKVVEVLAKLLTEDPQPPSSHRPGLDLRMEAICRQAMAKNPVDRFPSMAAFAAALETYLASPAVAGSASTLMLAPAETHLKPPPTPRRRWVLAAAATLAMCLVVVGLALRVPLPRKPRPPKVTTSPPPVVIQVEPQPTAAPAATKAGPTPDKPVTEVKKAELAKTESKKAEVAKTESKKAELAKTEVKKDEPAPAKAAAGPAKAASAPGAPAQAEPPKVAETPPVSPAPPAEPVKETRQDSPPATSTPPVSPTSPAMSLKEPTKEEATAAADIPPPPPVPLVGRATAPGSPSMTVGPLVRPPRPAFLEGPATTVGHPAPVAPEPAIPLASTTPSRTGPRLAPWTAPHVPPAPGGPVAKRAPTRLVNALGMTLVHIEPGEFVMGTTDAQFALLKRIFPTANHDLFAREGPAHIVRITRPFFIAEHPVTVRQFRRFVDQTGYQTEAERDGKGGHTWDETTRTWAQNPRCTWRTPGFLQGEDHPVVLVSWNDAHAFLKWLNTHENGSLHYRLPTEAEWEYACRAGTTTLFPNGDDPERLAAIANVADASARRKYPSWETLHADDGHVHTSPVGSFTPNAAGLYDMIGNVWEWCEDGFDHQFYRKAPLDDPLGPPAARTHVLRGGSWASTARSSRSASRNMFTPDYRSSGVGFRVVAIRVNRPPPKAAR